MPADKTKLTIFLAEDDADDVYIFRDLLTGLPYEVNLNVASNGIQLIRMLELANTLPDLVFLDINMPVKDGIQCLQEIRANASWKGICVNVLSTSCDPYQIDVSREQGATRYLVKATSYTTFREALSRCLGKDLKTDAFTV